MTNNSANLSSGIHKGLVKAANHFATKVNAKLNTPGYPSGNDVSNRPYKSIQATLDISPVRESGEGQSISVTYGGEDAPYTLAYEFGSGEHAEFGNKGSYKIPTDATWVMFPVGSGARSAARWPNYQGTKKTGDMIAFPQVDHPGIKAKPFIRPTIQAEMGAITKMIGDEFFIMLRTEFKDEVIK